MKKIVLLLFILAFLLQGCYKTFNKTFVDLTVLDAETGKPLPGMKIILAYFHDDYKSSSSWPESKVIGATDNNGQFRARLAILDEISNEYDGNAVFSYSDSPHYAISRVSIKENELNKATVRLVPCAQIEISYKHINPGSVIDNMGVGIIYDNMNYFYGDNSYPDVASYSFKNNLISLGTTYSFNSDTVLNIYCNPALTKGFYYKLPGKKIIESCSVKSGEVKKLIVLY
jgi:hypothetical protein